MRRSCGLLTGRLCGLLRNLHHIFLGFLIRKVAVQIFLQFHQVIAVEGEKSVDYGKLSLLDGRVNISVSQFRDHVVRNAGHKFFEKRADQLCAAYGCQRIDFIGNLPSGACEPD